MDSSEDPIVPRHLVSKALFGPLLGAIGTKPIYTTRSSPIWYPQIVQLRQEIASNASQSSRNEDFRAYDADEDSDNVTDPKSGVNQGPQVDLLISSPGNDLFKELFFDEDAQLNNKLEGETANEESDNVGEEELSENEREADEVIEILRRQRVDDFAASIDKWRRSIIQVDETM